MKFQRLFSGVFGVALMMLSGCSMLTTERFYIAKSETEWKLDNNGEGSFIAANYRKYYTYTYQGKESYIKTRIAPNTYRVAWSPLILPVIPMFGNKDYNKYLMIENEFHLKGKTLDCWDIKPEIRTPDNNVVEINSITWANDNTCSYRFYNMLGEDGEYTLKYKIALDNLSVPPLRLSVEKKWYQHLYIP